MGGSGSTRWGMTVTRLTTNGLQLLDVRALARADALRPGTVSTVTWGSRSITVAVPANAPQLMELSYHHILRGRRTAGKMRESVSLSRTACMFGGARVWFRCPGCDGLCAILYELNGRFRCRACHHLAYETTRMKCSPPPP